MAEADDQGQITRYFIHGLGLLAMVTPDNQVYTYHYDGNGNTIAVTDGAKQVVNKYAYLPYGKIISQEELIDQPFTFAGMVGIMEEGDPANDGFYYMRARYYDPSIGRFISEDPSGFSDGPNLYAYVGGSPLMFVDPWGLCKKKWQDVFIGSFWQETYVNNVRPIENMVNPIAQGVTEWSDSVNWQTVGIGSSEIFSGTLSVGKAIAVQTVTGGSGSSVSAFQAYIGVKLIGLGVTNVVLGLSGQVNAEQMITDSLKDSPLGNRLYQNIPR